MRRIRNNTRLFFQPLEKRLNLGVVTTTSDFDPSTYKALDQDTWKPGVLRYEIIKAMETGDSVTFNTDNEPGEVNFTTPQTILLNWGEVSINKSVHILAPRYQSKNDSLPLVEITWNASLNPDPNNDEDRSVFNIEIAKTTTDGRHPIYSPSVRLNGLKITGGEAKVGGGVYAKGFFDLYIQKSEISGNLLDNDDPADPKTTGAGIAAMSVAIDKDAAFRDSRKLYYGPRVRIDDSQIINNHSDTNDDENQTPPDIGGGIYLDKGASLFMWNSVVSGNSAENGAGGIYFAGGQQFENLTSISSGTQYANLFTTELKITNSVIADNAISSGTRKGSGGGLVVAGPTLGLIADTTFYGNLARQDGGGNLTLSYAFAA